MSYFSILTLLSVLIISISKQNAKVSVMGSGQLSQVMASVSKYASSLPLPIKHYTNPPLGIPPNIPPSKTKLRPNPPLSTQLPDYGTTGSSSPPIRVMSSDWDSRLRQGRGTLRVPVLRVVRRRRGMGAGEGSGCSGCRWLITKVMRKVEVHSCRWIYPSCPPRQPRDLTLSLAV